MNKIINECISSLIKYYTDRDKRAVMKKLIPWCVRVNKTFWLKSIYIATVNWIAMWHGRWKSISYYQTCQVLVVVNRKILFLKQFDWLAALSQGWTGMNIATLFVEIIS